MELLELPLEPLYELHEKASLVTLLLDFYNQAQSSESGKLVLTLKLCSVSPARLLLPQVPVTTDVASPALGLCSEALLFPALQKEPPGCLASLPLGGEV